MPLELDQNNAKFQIKAYKSGMIKVNDSTLHKSIIITADELLENWTPQSVEELTAEDFTNIPNLNPDILLIGTGERHQLIPVELYGQLVNAGIGVEVMATGAACRTFNALCSENRRVAAALLIA